MRRMIGMLAVAVTVAVVVGESTAQAQGYGGSPQYGGYQYGGSPQYGGGQQYCPPGANPYAMGAYGQTGVPAGMSQYGPGMYGEAPLGTGQLPPGVHGTPYREYAQTWKGRYVQPTNPQAPAGTFPTHKYKFEYHAPKNLVYPRAGQPAGVTVYPYYTTRGPTDFFMDDENALNR